MTATLPSAFLPGKPKLLDQVTRCKRKRVDPAARANSFLEKLRLD
jgi:hypothetical protein